jgi:large subunit ribosomal protein L6
MSRIGKKPIVIPVNVEVKLANNELIVKGPKGELKQKIHPQVKIEEKDKQLILTVEEPENKSQKALWGLFASIINNMIVGVTQGYEKNLEVIGVGFKVNIQGQKLVLNLGFSHPVEYQLPTGINAEVGKNTIKLTGIDKKLIGEVAAQIRRIKKPEPYQGKGIKYADEIIKKKAGKAAVKSSA